MREKNCVWLFYYCNFERNNAVLKSNAFCFTKIWTLIKRNRKWKIPHTSLERQNLCFSSYKNRKLNVKLYYNCTFSRKKKEGIFCTVYFVGRKFFSICVLSPCLWDCVWVGFCIFNSISFLLKFIFLLDKMHGLFHFIRS